MGNLIDKRIVQSRAFVEPDLAPIPDTDYYYTYPKTVFEAVLKNDEPDSSNLIDEFNAIDAKLLLKQDIIPANTSGSIITYTNEDGVIGARPVVKSVNKIPGLRSANNIPNEVAVGNIADSKANVVDLMTHVANNDVHMTSEEKDLWGSMTPLSTFTSHAANTTIHTTVEEKELWNSKADGSELTSHINNKNNPHSVTANQINVYTKPEMDAKLIAMQTKFFNYLNIVWDDKSGLVKLEEYSPINWDPNYILGFGERLPDIGNPNHTYFALAPATDYLTNQTNDIIIYIKKPSMVWIEAGRQTLTVGDLVVRYPDTAMFLWMGGRFVEILTRSGDDPGGIPGDNEIADGSVTIHKLAQDVIDFIESMKYELTEMPPYTMKANMTNENKLPSDVKLSEVITTAIDVASDNDILTLANRLESYITCNNVDNSIGRKFVFSNITESRFDNAINANGVWVATKNIGGVVRRMINNVSSNQNALGSIFYSLDDGENWSPVLMPITYDREWNINHDGERWIARTSDDRSHEFNDNIPLTIVSINGVDWNLPSVTEDLLTDYKYIDGCNVYIKSYMGFIFYSQDGDNWHEFEINHKIMFVEDIAYTDTNLVIIPFSGILPNTIDIDNWTNGVIAIVAIDDTGNMVIIIASGDMKYHVIMDPRNQETTMLPMPYAVNDGVYVGTLITPDFDDDTIYIYYSYNGKSWIKSDFSFKPDISLGRIYPDMAMSNDIISYYDNKWIITIPQQSLPMATRAKYIILTSVNATDWSGGYNDTIDTTPIHYTHDNKSIWLACDWRFISYSTDGINYVEAINDDDTYHEDIYTLSYNGTIWIANPVGIFRDGEVRPLSYYSINGKNWYRIGLVFEWTICENGIWLGLDDNGILYYSNNGINWDKCRTESNEDVSLFINMPYISYPKYANGIWVMLDRTPINRYSNDGITWLPINTSSNPIVMYQFNYIKNKWIGYNSKNSLDRENAGILYSIDGNNWIQTNISKDGIYNLYYDDIGNKFIADGLMGGITSSIVITLYSLDGENWYNVGKSLPGKWIGDYNNGKWIAYGMSDNGIAFSNDGEHWIVSNVIEGNFASPLFYNSGHHFAQLITDGERNGELFHSIDGEHWVVSNIPHDIPYHYENEIFFFTSDDGGIQYSVDGVNLLYSNITSGTYTEFYYKNNIWLAFPSYDGGSVLRSINGIEWDVVLENIEGPFTYSFGKDKWILGSNSGKWYSYDGAEWIYINNIPGTAHQVIYVKDTWLLATDMVLTFSKDGIHWLPTTIYAHEYDYYDIQILSNDHDIIINDRKNIEVSHSKDGIIYNPTNLSKLNSTIRIIPGEKSWLKLMDGRGGILYSK